ncbi:hypothetical protein FNF31_07296 [Cafeteria roenbergensis]|uniref:Uncharacterized protein n=1 Tax=Cafeteria roenbergensis TaxID=33653 RepID=A0A5A8C8F6_CAFRO|nr:hypothetical protein FNF31_07296 [Cafeteria roenbergensis]
MLVPMVVMLVAKWIVFVKWRDAFALRVSEAFPSGSDPAMAAAWLCPLGLASDAEEEALGFSCDLLLPTTPPSLAGNASSFAVNATALSYVVCGQYASIRSQPEVEAAFRSGYGWMLVLAFIVALLHVVAFTAWAWAALSARCTGRPGLCSLQLLLLLQDSVLPPLVPLPASLRLVVGRSWHVRHALTWTFVSPALAVGLAQGQYYDDRGVCSALAAVVAVVSAGMAVYVMPWGRVPGCRRGVAKREGAVNDEIAVGVVASLIAESACFACWSGQLLECWGSTWLGMARAPRDATLLREVSCESGWWVGLQCCLILWGLVPALWVGTGFALRGRIDGGLVQIVVGVVAIILLAMPSVATAVGVVLFSQPLVGFDIGFVEFGGIDVLTILLIAMIAFVQAESSREPFADERVLRLIQPHYGLRGFVTAHEARAALREVQRRAC